MNTFRFEKEGVIGKIILTDNPSEKKGLSFGDTLRSAVLAANGTDIRVLVLTSESGNFDSHQRSRRTVRARASMV